MKFLMIAVAVLCTQYAKAIVPDVQITSFLSTGRNVTTAELCGVVTNLKGMGTVNVIVDEKSGRPGHYRTFVEGSESFCLVVSTNAGTASVSVKGSSPVTVELAQKTSADDSVQSLSLRPWPVPTPRPKPWHCSAHRWDQPYPDYPGYPSTDRLQAEQSAVRACQAKETKYCNANCSQY
jgi:hypothetical protein